MISIYVRNIEDVWFGVATDEKVIFATSFASSEKRAMQSLLTNVPFDAPFQHLEKTSTFADEVISSIRDVYEGRNVSHSDFCLATEHLSDYSQRVVQTISLIPVGYVTSYGSVAKTAGGSPRSVGHVMALNPFAPIVPCHRVVNSNFTLGGYGGGLNVKFEILRRESRGYSSERKIVVNDKEMQVFPVEFALARFEKDKF